MRLQKFLNAALLLGLFFAASGVAQIVSVSPPQHALNVALNNNIEVSFAQDINAVTLNSATFRVYGAQSGYHPGTINYIAASKKAVFTPALPFFPGEVVYVALTNGITSSAGQPLNKFAWHFTVAVAISSGQFASKSSMAVGSLPRSIAGADFDNDGDVDLAVANGGSNTISILKNNGDATFQAKQDYVAGYYPFFVVAGDWDADGDMDLAIAHNDNRIEDLSGVDTDSITILKNNGNGGFQTKRRYPIIINSRAVVAADIDGDGDLDLIVPNGYGQGRATLLRNDGIGLFNDNLIVVTDYSPNSAFSADVDNDGDMDFLIANGGWARGGGTDGSVAIFKNNGNGLQSKVDYYRAGGAPQGVVISDFDLDGDGDLVVPNYILKNKGDGSFQSPILIPTAVSTSFISAADVDGDGDMDLAMAGYVASIFKNKGDGTFLPQQAYATGSQLSGLWVADLDRDGDMDLAVGNISEKSVTIFSNRGLILTNPLVLNFGGVYIGYPKEANLTFCNYSANSVSVANVVSNNPKFAIIGRTAFNVGARDSVKIAVRYAPTAAMSDTGSISVFSSAAPTEHIAVSGSGLAPVAILSAAPNALALGSVTIAKTSDLIVNLSNSGLADLQITSIINSNPHFSVAGGPTLRIRPQETKAIAVRFTASFIGSQADTLRLFNNDATKNPFKIPMSAIGSASLLSEISVQTPLLQFDSVAVNQTKTLALKIYNRGAANLQVTNITSNNTRFTLTAPVNFTLAPGDSNTVNVKFSPTAAGSQTGTVTITNNDANENPLLVRVSGSGVKTTSIHERKNSVPAEFQLEQNYPNPVSLAVKSAETTIKYQLPKNSFVTLKVFDILGREMVTLVNASQAPGYYNVAWNGRNTAGQLVPGGIYICRLQAGSFERVMKMMVVR